MARLIDADVLIEEALTEGVCGYIDALQIAMAPTVDAVEVVRCKDCKYGEVDNTDFHDQYLCHYNGSDWNCGNHFCSYGERKVAIGDGCCGKPD